jgi:starch-binding outer membrane protein, SusD/RagB family
MTRRDRALAALFMASASLTQACGSDDTSRDADAAVDASAPNAPDAGPDNTSHDAAVDGSVPNAPDAALEAPDADTSQPDASDEFDASAPSGCGPCGCGNFNDTLSYLTPSVGALSPEFRSNIEQYTVEVEYWDEEVTLTPKATESRAVLTVNDAPVDDDTPSDAISLPLGETTVTVRVSRECGEPTREYAVTFVRTLPDEAAVLRGVAHAYAWLGDAEAGPYGGLGNWLHGSVRGGDAHKGGALASQPEAAALARFEATAANQAVLAKWRASYEGIDRCNLALRMIELCTDGGFTQPERDELRGQLRFLRAVWYFDLVRLFGQVPWIAETHDAQTALEVENDVDIYDDIEADLAFAIDHLSNGAAPIAGRPNSWSAMGMLGKVQLTRGQHADALATLAPLLANGVAPSGARLALLSGYGDVFASALPNHHEALFGIHTSPNAPVPAGTSGPAGCCGFFQPSLGQARAHRTDANGLPLLDGSFLTTPFTTDLGVASASPFTPDAGALDPRIHHNLGTRGIPFLDWGLHAGADWITDPSAGGPYSPRKYVQTNLEFPWSFMPSGRPRGVTNENQTLLRYADVLLMAAECEIEAGTLEQAREYVNRVRARAANPASWVKLPNGSNAANYVIGLYNTPWTDAAAARSAVRFERRLELAGEGHRFFDLVRWGVAATELNAHLAFEGASLPATLADASFTAGVDELYPIPAAEIARREPGVLTQNPGY